MRPGEILLHARKKAWQFVDAQSQRDWRRWKLKASGAFPPLPNPVQAPQVLRDALQRDMKNILAGRWKVFGHLDVQVDDPPKWHCDYLAGQDLKTMELAFKLNHRELPGGADIKLIWELSRWHQLVRLAMAVYVLGDERAARKCLEWLTDWVQHNPPYRGWNWTSALEVGMRLIQFTWIDRLLRAFLTSDGSSLQSMAERLEQLRYELLPPHAWYAWRYKSFGSSANNHLLGELVGLILATVRWPALERWAAPLDELQRRWEHEVLAQFAEDGGNKEQALNYHLFSWEFCWQAMSALHKAGRAISPEVSERLYKAVDFFVQVQVETDPWDYGDSDNAFVTPCFASESSVVSEWRQWFISHPHSPAIEFWLGEARRNCRDEFVKGTSIGEKQPLDALKPKPVQVLPENPAAVWVIYPNSGIAVCRSGFWTVRWDLSPLGHLKPAAHGHLDALHLSVWFKGVGIVIDPGTGAYYADQTLRAWLASRQAHNGPCPAACDYPKRLGPFLWAGHHAVPAVSERQGEFFGELSLPQGRIERRVRHSSDGLSWWVEDAFKTAVGRSSEFSVCWQFAPGCWVKQLDQRKFSVNRANVSVMIEVNASWADIILVEPADRKRQSFLPSAATDEELFAGIVSPAFRKIERASFLKLVARPDDKPGVFRTTFLVSAFADVQ
jgi:hypothetical protein